MTVLELLVGRLAIDRQLITEPLLQHCLSQGGGQGLGDMLVAQGFPPDTVQALFNEAQHAQMLCTGCGARYGVPHLQPQDPWSCRSCGNELILLGNEDSRRLGTGRWVPGHPSDYPTSTGSHRHPAHNTPGVDTRPGSDRWRMGTPPTHPGVAPTGSGSGSWRGSGSGFSVSQRFRNKLAPGTVLDGHEILAELGRGGMGIVFKARHLGRGDLVALKVLLAGAMATERQQQRFQREAEALAKLGHPNIVRVFDMGDLGDHMYFTMEFVDGQPLSDQIKGKRISLRRAVEIARDIARGLQHAHENEIIHRDIKPDNILMDQSGTPLITDFGLVRDAANESRLTRSGAVLGTPYYMSPEQASGKGHHLDGSADVYSLGTVLYQMLTGELPFDGATQIELTKKIIELPAPAPSKQNGQVPPELDAVVLKTLAKTTEERYDTAADFADDLDRFLRGEPVHAKPRSAINPKLIVRGLVGLIAVGVLGLGIALIVRSWGEGTGPGPTPTPTATAVDPKAAAARKAALDKAEDLWREAERVPIGLYRATLWKLVEVIEESLKVAGDAPRLHFLRGVVHNRLQKVDQAKASYEKAIELDPKGEFGIRSAFHLARMLSHELDGKARAHKRIVAFEAAAGPAPEPATEPWRGFLRALGLYYARPPDIPGALKTLEAAELLAKVELGEVMALKSRLLFAMGEVDDAFDVLQQAIRVDPKDATNWASRGSFYAAVRDDTEQGLRDVERALTLDPENIAALELRGCVRVMQKDEARGKRDLERVLQRQPASELALRNMVILLMDREQKRAMDLMRRAEASEPTAINVYMLQADMLMDTDRLSDGLDALARGLEAVWKHPRKRNRLLLRLEELAFGARRTEAMQRIAARLDKKFPGNVYSKVFRGHAAAYESRDPLASLRHWDGCQKATRDGLFVWERRVRILFTAKGDSPELRREMARFIEAAQTVKSAQALSYAARYEAVVRERVSEARRLTKAATDAEPFDTEAWVTRAFVELANDSVAAGLKYVKRALAITPENSEANYLLGRAMIQKKDLEAAARAFQRSVLLNPYSSEQVGVMCALLLRHKRWKDVINITGRNGRRLQGLKMSPSPTLVLHRARAIAGLGRPERANALLDELVKAPLRSPKTRRYLAQVLGDVGRIEDARRVLKRLLKDFPNDRRAADLLQKLPPPPGK